jgi:hypothetical protein
VINRVNFSFNRKVTKEIPHVLVAGAKTSLFAKIYTSLLRLLTVATFQNFLTLIVRLLPTHYAMCGKRIQNANFKIQNLDSKIFFVHLYICLPV